MNDGGTSKVQDALTVDSLLDLGRSLFPPNLVDACIFQYRTRLVPNASEPDKYKLAIETQKMDGTNILGLLVASVAIGVAILHLKQEAEPVADFFRALMAIAMKITTWVVRLSPIGVMFLVAHEVIKMEDLGTVIGSLGKYFGTVVVGLAIHGFLVLPTIYFLLTRKNPYTFIGQMSEAITTAFGTASSSATLPVTIRCLEDNVGVDKRIARFALPIGSVINLDGTALYEAVAAVFIAQMRDVDLNVGKLIVITITATAAAIGAAGIPQAGAVTMIMILNTLGLPATDISLIIGVDWLLDRCRTAVNVMGDSFGAAIVAHRSQKELARTTETRRTSRSNARKISVLGQAQIFVDT
ncbi:unnamed protein product [Acanthoscelides obtectus]|uniref:Amino acid transporter n=1 Tax=Acanthoscelides obtectus TaxID=200917 RepID=A0A9P0L259_ACAOB|nr:unnamed protein product [Acanthoscelides obtectus]CAK1659365.1 Excitatory amino acid transporter 1 [Acanthoscelides obtectus]